jgi:uncharacterized membrane protein YhhN
MSAAAHQPGPAYLVLAAADTALAAAGGERARWVTKPLLMPALLRRRDRRTQMALALCGAGDVALLGSSPAAFTTGLGCFLAGHLAWIPALRARHGCGLLRRRPVAAVPVVVVCAAFNVYLWNRSGRDRLPVVAYSAVLSGMALAAVDTGVPRAAAGGGLFVLSDALIAVDRFGGVRLPLHEAWVMATYTTAQALLAS